MIQILIALITALFLFGANYANASTYDVYYSVSGSHYDMSLDSSPYTEFGLSESTTLTTGPGSQVSVRNGASGYGSSFDISLTSDPSVTSYASVTVSQDEYFTFRQMTPPDVPHPIIQWVTWAEWDASSFTGTPVISGMFSTQYSVFDSHGNQMIGSIYPEINASLNGVLNPKGNLYLNPFLMTVPVQFINLIPDEVYHFEASTTLTVYLAEPIPEPSTLFLYGLGLCLVASLRIYRRRTFRP